MNLNWNKRKIKPLSDNVTKLRKQVTQKAK